MMLAGGAVALGVGLSLLAPGSYRAARADEVQYVTDCSSDAGVRGALAAGGSWEFACSGTITTGAAGDFVVTKTVSLDAAGHTVTLRASSNRVFRVAGGTLTLTGVTIKDGRALGAKGATGADGTDAPYYGTWPSAPGDNGGDGTPGADAEAKKL